ncbi:MAG: acylphosphatase [Candidatus Latescibacterota bacterium]
MSGRVQGVGFRAFAQSQARRRGLTGYVRNLRDGGVEVVAVGPRPELEELLAALRSGPAGSVVRDCHVAWMAPAARYESFTIEY